MLSKHQHLVFHSGRRDDGTVLHGQQVLDAKRIDEIVGITLRDGGQFMSVDAGDVGVFAVIPEHVGYISSPLEHVATAG